MNHDVSTIEVNPPEDTACERTPILTPYEKMVGQYAEDDIMMMKSVRDYIMNQIPEIDFGDEMWIHNCYNEDLNMRTQEPQDNNAHFSIVDLTDEFNMEFKRHMNARVYLNLLESNSIVKKDNEYNFAMMPPYESERLRISTLKILKYSTGW